MLPPLLRRDMFHYRLLSALRNKTADETRVPQLACDAQVFATAHQRVRLAAFGGRRDAIGIKVLLLAASD